MIKLILVFIVFLLSMYSCSHSTLKQEEQTYLYTCYLDFGLEQVLKIPFDVPMTKKEKDVIIDNISLKLHKDLNIDNVLQTCIKSE